MSKEQIVSDALKKIADGQAQVLTDAIGAAVDTAAQEQKAADGTLTQADVDAAVKAAVDPLLQQLADLQAKDDADVKAAADAKAAGEAAMAALADLQAKFDDLAKKESVEAGIIDGLKGSLESLQKVVSDLSGFLPAPPAP